MMSASSTRAASHMSGSVDQLMSVRIQVGPSGSVTPTSHRTLRITLLMIWSVRAGSIATASVISPHPESCASSASNAAKQMGPTRYNYPWGSACRYRDRTTLYPH